MVSWLPRMSYPPLIPAVTKDLNLTYADAGLLMTGLWIGYLLMQMPSGFISDRIGVKRTFQVALPLIGVICILTGTASNFTTFLAYRFLNGLVSGFIFALGSALVIRWFPPKDRAMVIGLYLTSGSVGQIAALTTSSWILAALGSWRWPFWLLGFLPIATTIPVTIKIKETPESTATMVASEESMAFAEGNKREKPGFT